MSDPLIQAIIIVAVMLVLMRFWKAVLAILAVAIITFAVMGAETIASALHATGH